MPTLLFSIIFLPLIMTMKLMGLIFSLILGGGSSKRADNPPPQRGRMLEDKKTPIQMESTVLKVAPVAKLTSPCHACGEDYPNSDDKCYRCGSYRDDPFKLD